jgi:hypothetical protein
MSPFYGASASLFEPVKQYFYTEPFYVFDFTAGYGGWTNQIKTI